MYLEPIVFAGVCEVNHQFPTLIALRLQRQQHMIK